MTYQEERQVEHHVSNESVRKGLVRNGSKDTSRTCTLQLKQLDLVPKDPEQNLEGTWQASKTPDPEPEAEQQRHQVILMEAIGESPGRKMMQWEFRAELGRTLENKHKMTEQTIKHSDAKFEQNSDGTLKEERKKESHPSKEATRGLRRSKAARAELGRDFAQYQHRSSLKR